MKAFARALALFGAGSVIGTLTQIAKGKVGALLLGVEGIGILSQLTNAWSLLYTLGGLGFYNGVVHKIAESSSTGDHRGVRAQFSSSLVFLTAFSILCTLAAVAAAAPISNLILSDDGRHAGLVCLVLASVPFGVAAQVYGGLFSGLRLVRKVVTVQVISDLLSVPIFIFLALKGNLQGAAIAFSASNIVKLAIQIYVARKSLSPVGDTFSLSDFNWREIASSARFGTSGLLLVSTGTITTMAVSRLLIDNLGTHGNGIFSVAWKVCGLYFGALYASASGYYYPMLSTAKSDVEMKLGINEAVTLYMYVLPPVAAAIMIGGGQLMVILFSNEFAAAASILLLLLLGDLFRILAESVGLSFLATRRLKIYNLTYLLWAVAFMTLAWFLTPSFGLVGVGCAYIVSQLLNATVCLFLANRSFGFSMSSTAAHAFAAGLLTLVTTALVMSSDAGGKQLVGGVVVLAWFLVSLRDPQFRTLGLAIVSRARRIFQ